MLYFVDIRTHILASYVILFSLNYETKFRFHGGIMRILIVDDNAENLDAAKQAAAGCSEHEFQFVSSAKQALDLFTDSDGIITDLFFPDEGHKDGSLLDKRFSAYRRSFQFNDDVEKVYRRYYQGQGRIGDERGDRAVGDLLSLCEDGGYILILRKDPSLYFQSLEDKSRLLEFPYGAAIVLESRAQGKRVCLVSDIHHHAGSITRGIAKYVDGMLLLSPLVAAGIISYENARRDGEEGNTYLGSDGIWQAGKGKTDPAVWAEAIKRVLSQ